MSRVTSQGPLSAVASSWPLPLACWAIRASADAGRPSISSWVVSSLLNALVESRTLLLKLVLSFVSSSAISLNRVLACKHRLLCWIHQSAQCHHCVKE